MMGVGWECVSERGVRGRLNIRPAVPSHLVFRYKVTCKVTLLVISGPCTHIHTAYRLFKPRAAKPHSWYPQYAVHSVYTHSWYPQWVYAVHSV